MRIRLRLLLVTVAPTILIFVVGMYATQIGERHLRRSIAASSNADTGAKMDEIDRFIDTRCSQWRAYAEGSSVIRVLEESNRRFAGSPDPARNVAEEDRRWTETPPGETSPLMREILGNDLSRDLRAMLGQLKLESGRPVFGEVFLTNRFGANVAQSSRTSDYRQDDEEWWQVAWHDTIHVGEVGYDQSSGIYSTDIAFRIDDRLGRPQGVLKAVLNIEEAFSLLDQHPEDPGEAPARSLLLFTSDRRVVYRDGGPEIPLEDGSRFFPPQGLPTSAHPVTLERIDGRTGERMLSTYAVSRGHAGYRGLGWILLQEYRADAVFHPVTVLRERILLISLAAMVLSALHAILFSMSLSRRLAGLAETARALGRGELETTAAEEGSDEISQLAATLNAMSRDLEASRLELIDNSVDLARQYVALERESEERQRAEEARLLAEEERGLIEVQLRHAQKLESVGQLAAGIAHEINTPMQYLGDNLRFLQESTGTLLNLLRRLRKRAAEGGSPGDEEDFQAFAAGAIEAADPDFLAEEVPRSLAQSIEGAARVTGIVRALKEFSHPGSVQKTPFDLNRAIQTTLTVARNEWKYVARVNTELDPDLPLAPCVPGEINQALLNLVVNAAHAIGEKNGNSGDLGTITIRTSHDDTSVFVSIEDTGVGIPDEIRGRIFDPFFTTKEVGKGTGQGLAIVHLVVVGKHAGRIEVDSHPGVGTAFRLQLPLNASPDSSVSRAA
jgi:signal transduction histidine kinase